MVDQLEKLQLRIAEDLEIIDYAIRKEQQLKKPILFDINEAKLSERPKEYIDLIAKGVDPVKAFCELAPKKVIHQRANGYNDRAYGDTLVDRFGYQRRYEYTL